MRGMEGFAIAEDQYETSLDIFVDDLRNILNHLGIDDVVYAGESFGGVSGLNFAHKYPHWTGCWHCATPPAACLAGSVPAGEGTGMPPRARV